MANKKSYVFQVSFLGLSVYLIVKKRSELNKIRLKFSRGKNAVTCEKLSHFSPISFLLLVAFPRICFPTSHFSLTNFQTKY